MDLNPSPQQTLDNFFLSPEVLRASLLLENVTLSWQAMREQVLGPLSSDGGTIYCELSVGEA